MNKSISIMLALIVMVVVGLTMGEDGVVGKLSHPAGPPPSGQTAAPAPAMAQPHHVNPWAVDSTSAASAAYSAGPVVILPAFDHAPKKVALPAEIVDPAVAGASEIR